MKGVGRPSPPFPRIHPSIIALSFPVHLSLSLYSSREPFLPNLSGRQRASRMPGRSPLRLLATLLIILQLAAIQLAVTPPASPTSAYEVLRRHGLPIGLLPKGVQDFRIDAEGRFEVHLPAECTAKFETEVHYERNVTGSLSYGQIAAISGVTAQELFLWFPVRAIRVDIPSSGLIYFDVGVIYKQFSLSLFDTPPDCSPASRDRLPDAARLPLSISSFSQPTSVSADW